MDIGPILLIIVFVVGVPLVFLGGMIVAGILGWVLKDEAEATHAGSELIGLNR